MTVTTAADAAAGLETPALRISGLGKTFGSFSALRDVNLDVAAGSVHALVGANGAGKSTCMGVLAGRTPATTGSIEVFGDLLPTGSPRAARARGVAAIYQELTIVPSISSQANVFLGCPQARLGWLSEAAMRKEYVRLCNRLGVIARLDVNAASLSVADQQLLEIMRALHTEARILLMDEPTASLAKPERTALLNLIGELRERGVTILFVSHNLDEVLGVADNVTCFRDGRLVCTEPAAALSKHSLLQAMVGEPGVRLPVGSGPRHTSGVRKPILTVESLRIPGIVSGVSFEVGQGEILGIAGLVGSGRSSILRACAGMQPPASGSMTVEGTRVDWPQSVRQARRLGIALVPEDRKALGLMPAMTAAENIVLSDYGAVSRCGFVRRKQVDEQASAHGAFVGFDRSRLRTTARHLSGGNQQKLLLARWRHHVPRILLFDEPTRGIDVGAKAEVIETIRSMCAEGLAAIFVSSELDEVVDLSDRIIVVRQGAVVGVFDQSARRVTAHELLQAAFAEVGAS